jgi:hypothetical protein
LAASNRRPRTMPSPHLETRPARLNGLFLRWRPEVRRS